MLNHILNLGKWLFALPFGVYGLMHFALADFTASMIPSYLPAPYFWVYLTGAALLLFVASVVVGKFDKLASLLLALMLLLFILTIHIPNAGRDEKAVIGIFRDTLTMGGALMYAKGFAKDDQFVPK
jgi:uncharacterized membrane protein YphA (DoxX/SURF4 family)